MTYFFKKLRLSIYHPFLPFLWVPALRLLVVPHSHQSRRCRVGTSIFTLILSDRASLINLTGGLLLLFYVNLFTTLWSSLNEGWTAYYVPTDPLCPSLSPCPDPFLIVVPTPFLGKTQQPPGQQPVVLTSLLPRTGGLRLSVTQTSMCPELFSISLLPRLTRYNPRVPRVSNCAWASTYYLYMAPCSGDRTPCSDVCNLSIDFGLLKVWIVPRPHSSCRN